MSPRSYAAIRRSISWPQASAISGDAKPSFDNCYSTQSATYAWSAGGSDRTCCRISSRVDMVMTSSNAMLSKSRRKQPKDRADFEACIESARQTLLASHEQYPVNPVHRGAQHRVGIGFFDDSNIAAVRLPVSSTAAVSAAWTESARRGRRWRRSSGGRLCRRTSRTAC